MRDRSKLISIEISDKAKKIYDKQQHKGEFVSDAIIEKADREQGNSLEDRVRVLEAEVKELRERMGK